MIDLGEKLEETCKIAHEQLEKSSAKATKVLQKRNQSSTVESGRQSVDTATNEGKQATHAVERTVQDCTEVGTYELHSPNRRKEKNIAY